MNLLDAIRETLAPFGLNLIGTTSVAQYETLVPPQYYVNTLLPQAKSIVVIGNGGGDFWRGFRLHCEQHPGYMEEHAHPLDDYTVKLIEMMLTPLLQTSGRTYRYLYPFQFWTEPVSFMHLARAAGLAGPSILGVLIHPEYGPWMALRAGLLIDQDLSTSSQTPDFDPCPTCTERPCISACPAGAISTEKNWDIPSCVRHRLRVTEDCIDYCRARFDCVYGRAHRYPLDELQYHQKQSFAEMRKYFEEPSTRNGED